MECALQAQKPLIAEYLAPLSKLEDDKVYSEIPEAQFWPQSSHSVDEDDRSFVSEEAIKNEDEKQEDPESVYLRQQEQEKRKIEALTNEMKEKLNMQDFDLEVTKYD